MKLTNEQKYVYFWAGPFSQWAESEFTVAGIKYLTAEQWMMASKARLFGDTETLVKILETADPKTQKKLGREVSGFDPVIWERNRFAIVLAGSIAKFSQNENLKKVLMDTGTAVLVEASPYDNIWGIGMRENEAGIEDPTNWKGLNLLGQALTAAREYIRTQEMFK